MKTDLDKLMTERGYAALLVSGPSTNNPPMYYLSNGVSIGERSLLVKPRGQDPVLLVSGMERDEAAKSGLRVIDLAQYRLADLLKEERGDSLRATARLYGRVFADLGVSGKVVVYGHVDQGAAYALLSAIEELNPGLQIAGEYGDSVFQTAAATKDAAEVRRIRAVGKQTVAVVGETAEFLTSHRVQGDYLVKRDGSRLLLGEVKAFINRRLLEHGVVDAEAGTIFAQGRDGGVPHSRGDARQPMRLGRSIVFDIFPAEPGGGYFFDFTRTWCLGYAPDHVLEAYEQVREVYQQTLKALKPGAPCRDYQTLVCDYFEARGHPTIRTNPATTDGYVHSLGHGVGLYIHEAPSLSDRAGNTTVLEPGHVLTVEPGLYYPDHPQGGFGVRLEDTVWLNPATLKFEILARYPYDLILPVKPAKSLKPKSPHPKPQSRRRRRV